MPLFAVVPVVVGLAAVGFVFYATARLSPPLRPAWTRGDPLPARVQPWLAPAGVMVGVTLSGDGDVTPLMWD